MKHPGTQTLHRFGAAGTAVAPPGHPLRHLPGQSPTVRAPSALCKPEPITEQRLLACPTTTLPTGPGVSYPTGVFVCCPGAPLPVAPPWQSWPVPCSTICCSSEQCTNNGPYLRQRVGYKWSEDLCAQGPLGWPCRDAPGAGGRADLQTPVCGSVDMALSQKQPLGWDPSSSCS